MVGSLVRLIVEEALRRGNSVWWRPRGFCMVPAIRDGERVLVAPVSSRALRIGDIVQYASPDGLRVHRLLGRRRDPSGETRLVLGGDNSEEPLEVARPADLLGRVVAVEREGRVTRLDSWWKRRVGLVRAWTRRVRRPGRVVGP